MNSFEQIPASSPAQKNSEDAVLGAEKERNPNIWKTVFVHEEETKLILISPEDLGFDAMPSVADFFSKAREKGLILCPPGTGGALFERLLDGIDTPEEDLFFIMTDSPSEAQGPITTTDDSPPVFSAPIERIQGITENSVSGFPEGDRAVPEMKKDWITGDIPPGSRWVFALKK